MKLLHRFHVLPCALVALVFTLYSISGASEPAAAACKYVTVAVPAPSLAGNLTGEAAERPVYVYLPPSYHDSEVRYPVLYFFAGYYDKSDIDFLAGVVAELMQEKEFIVVSITDGNSLHGSFGASSPVIGNWRDFFLKDAIPYIDSHFRTIATADGRIVSGASMGGHIALRLAFEHPEVFSALYALFPGVFAENGLEHAMPTWDQTFLNAYGAAYAPNMDKPYPHADYPSMDGSPEDLAIRAKWNKGFGELPQLLDAYLAQPVRLKAIAVEVGSNDEYPWIPEGCIYFNNLLCERKIAHTFLYTNGHHWMNEEVFRSGMGPFAVRYFGGQK
jgi:pimeloyl-ACP methyl ester carboxylesterase